MKSATCKLSRRRRMARCQHARDRGTGVPCIAHTEMSTDRDSFSSSASNSTVTKEIRTIGSKCGRRRKTVDGEPPRGPSTSISKRYRGPCAWLSALPSMQVAFAKQIGHASSASAATAPSNSQHTWKTQPHRGQGIRVQRTRQTLSLLHQYYSTVPCHEHSERKLPVSNTQRALPQNCQRRPRCPFVRSCCVAGGWTMSSKVQAAFGCTDSTAGALIHESLRVAGSEACCAIDTGIVSQVWGISWQRLSSLMIPAAQRHRQLFRPSLLPNRPTAVPMRARPRGSRHESLDCSW